MGDEPTIGELARVIDNLRRSVEQLAGKVLTVEVWKAERELLEMRIRENEKDITAQDADAKADRKQRELDKAAADARASANRRQALFAVLTSLVFPILVAVVLAWILKG